MPRLRLILLVALFCLPGCRSSRGRAPVLSRRLGLTLSFYRSENLKPGAPVRYKKIVIGKVMGIDYGEKGVALVRVLLEPDGKDYARISSSFRIDSGMLGIHDSYITVEVADLHAARLSNGARVEGTESLGGKVAKLRDRVRSGAKAVKKRLQGSQGD